MTNVKLTDEQWTKMQAFLKQDANAYVGNADNCRRFIEAVMWISRSGAQSRYPLTLSAIQVN